MDISDKHRRSLVMVRIPAGVFKMGSAYGHGERDELPLHDVWVDEFLIAKYPVTALEWAKFLNSLGGPHPEYFEPSRETTVLRANGRYYPRRECSGHPANGVTWHGANAYCEWLAGRTGLLFRLPTEAEWEKAARGGLDSMYYPWGNDNPEGRAQYHQIMIEPRLTLGPVGSFAPNAYGLHDLAGNVWEWCSDWYDPDYYRGSPFRNPKGPETGRQKVIRGGSWGGLDVQIRCGIRVGEFPEISEARVGFRLARTA